MTDEALTPDLAEKLGRLFDTIRRPDGKEYSNQAVAEAITAAGGPSISRIYLWELRNGKKTNPTKRHLEALANFFEVPVAYFFDDHQSKQIGAELELLGSLRNAGVRNIALRANDLSPESLSAIAAMIENARQLEGLSDE